MSDLRYWLGYTRTLTQVVVDLWFKMEEFLYKMAISLKNGRVEYKKHSSLAKWNGLSLSCDHWLRLVDILSVDLDTSASLAHSKTQLQKAFSANAGTFSLWHSHHPNRYMGWCRCHEILIWRSFNVLFLTHFSQIPLQSFYRPLFCKLKNSSTK